ncbi:MAG: RNA methyltransferase, partial [Pseudomonadota bacterium]
MSKNRSSRRSAASLRTRPEPVWLYGRHAVLAALNNPERPLRRIVSTPSALEWLADNGAPAPLLRKVSPSDHDAVSAATGAGAVHQGLAALVDELPRVRLRDACADPEQTSVVVVLDQVTDPQNIGAIFRSAFAFNVRALIAQDRRTPPLAGALAKAAAGAVETLPFVSVVNIARAIEGLQGLGYHCAGLAAKQGAHPIGALPNRKPIALVLGAEGDGLRLKVGETCDALYRIPIAREMESLNVSNAAAIALYAAASRDG